MKKVNRASSSLILASVHWPGFPQIEEIHQMCLDRVAWLLLWALQHKGISLIYSLGPRAWTPVCEIPIEALLTLSVQEHMMQNYFLVIIQQACWEIRLAVENKCEMHFTEEFRKWCHPGSEPQEENVCWLVWCESQLSPTVSNFEHLHLDSWCCFVEPSGNSTRLAEVGPLEADLWLFDSIPVLAPVPFSAATGATPPGPSNSVKNWVKSNFPSCKLFISGILVKVTDSSGNARKITSVVLRGLPLLSVSFKI